METGFDVPESFIPTKNILDAMCDNKDLIEDSHKFIEKLGKKIESIFPIDQVRFPIPFVRNGETMYSQEQNDSLNRVFKIIGGGTPTENLTWSEVIINILKNFTYNSELINRRIEGTQKISPESIKIKQEVKNIKRFLPSSEIIANQLYVKQSPLILSFLLVFILREYNIPRKIKVYRGISRVIAQPIEESLKKANTYIQKLKSAYSLIRNDVPYYLYIKLVYVISQFTIATQFGKKDEIKRIKNELKKLPLEKILTDEFFDLTKGDPNIILNTPDILYIKILTNKISDTLVDINSERTLKFIDQLKNKGDTITNKRFWSTSLSTEWVEKIFIDESKCCSLTIDIPAGANALYINGRVNEAEVLVPPCSKFELVSRTQNKINLKYVSNYKKNTSDDWKLFIQILRQYVINEATIKDLATGNTIFRGNEVLISNNEITRMKKYLSCD